MKTKTVKSFLLIALYLLIHSSVFSQSLSPEVVSSSGEHFENTSGSVSFTVGEPVIETASDGTNTLTQGFHQGLITITDITKIDVGYQVNVFPNPTSGVVNIDGKMSKYELYDASGKLIMTSEIISGKQNLDFSEYAAGLFILKVFDTESNDMREFKIVKNK